jgi:hypothetical protein
VHKYFFNKEKSLAETKCIRALDCYNKVVTDLKDILTEPNKYYESLYKEKNTYSKSEIEEATLYFVDQTKVQTLTDNDKKKRT